MRRLLDGVAMLVPHRSMEPARQSHRREMTMHPTHWLISTQRRTSSKLLQASHATLTKGDNEGHAIQHFVMTPSVPSDPINS